MSSTPKAVRRNWGNCVCSARLCDLAEAKGVCRYGYCTEFRCPDCGGSLGGWGPIACPHKKRETTRWVRYPGMRDLSVFDLEKDDLVEVHAAIKPSIAKRRNKR